MKKAMRCALCVLLALALLAGLISCDSGAGEAEYDRGASFSVVQEAIGYSDDFVEAATARFVAIAERFIEAYYGISASDAQRQSFRAQFKKTVIPACLRVRIYEGELDRLLCGLEGLTEAEPSAAALASVYEGLLYSIGSRRSGALVFELTKSLIASRQATAQSRYEQYGYAWYLEEAEELSALQSALCEIGEEKFGAVASMASLLASSAIRIGLPSSEGRLALSGTDMLFVLEYHAEYFVSLGITEAEAEVLGGVLDALIPERSGSLLAAHLYALKTDGYFSGAARVIPHFATFYASVATALRSNGELSIGGGDPSAAARALCRALGDCEGELRAFLGALDTYMATASQRELDAIRQSGASDALERFLAEERTMTDEELVATVRSLSASASADIAVELRDAVAARLMATAPYVIFTLTE